MTQWDDNRAQYSINPDDQSDTTFQYRGRLAGHRVLAEVTNSSGPPPFQNIGLAIPSTPLAKTTPSVDPAPMTAMVQGGLDQYAQAFLASHGQNATPAANQLNHMAYHSPPNDQLQGLPDMGSPYPAMALSAGWDIAGTQSVAHLDDTASASAQSGPASSALAASINRPSPNSTAVTTLAQASNQVPATPSPPPVWNLNRPAPKSRHSTTTSAATRLPGSVHQASLPLTVKPTTLAAKIRKPRGTASGAPPAPSTLGYYNGDDKASLQLIKTIVAGRVVMGYGFPEGVTRLRMVNEAWTEGVKQMPDMTVQLNRSTTKICFDHISTVRSRFKKVAADTIKVALGLIEPQAGSEGAEQRRLENATKVALALEGKNYLFREYVSVKDRGGAFRSPMIATVLCETFFKGSQSDGASLFEDFSPQVTVETVAFVCTAIENALRDWVTGYHVPKDFSTKACSAIYESLLSDFSIYEDGRPEIALTTRQLLSNSAARKAGLELPHPDGGSLGRGSMFISSFELAETDRD